MYNLCGVRLWLDARQLESVWVVPCCVPATKGMMVAGWQCVRKLAGCLEASSRHINHTMPWWAGQPRSRSRDVTACGRILPEHQAASIFIERCSRRLLAVLCLLGRRLPARVVSPSPSPHRYPAVSRLPVSTGARAALCGLCALRCCQQQFNVQLLFVRKFGIPLCCTLTNSDRQTINASISKVGLGF